MKISEKLYAGINAGPGVRGGMIAVCLTLLAAGPVLADTSINPARQIMGRTTYPAKAWGVSTELDYNMNSIKDAMRDTAGHELGFDYGLTDAWNAGTGIESREGRRRDFVYDRLAFKTRYMVMKRPFQLSPFVEYLPSLRKEADEWKLGLEALKNYGNLSLQVIGNAEPGKQSDSARKLEGWLHLGAYYRFGAGNMAGVMWAYHTYEESSLHLHYAAALGKKTFLGVEPKIGLSRRSPDLSVDFLLGVYFGPYGLLDWMLE